MRFKNFLHELVRLHHRRREDRARPLLRLHQIFLTKFANWRNLKTTASFHLRNLKPRRPNCSANFDARLSTRLVSYQTQIHHSIYPFSHHLRHCSLSVGVTSKAWLCSTTYFAKLAANAFTLANSGTSNVAWICVGSPASSLALSSRMEPPTTA